MENWKPISGFEGLYEISNQGRVKSLARPTNNPIRPFIFESILKPRVGKTGYLYLTLYKNGKQTTHKVHRLVASAFCDNQLSKPHVNHKNGNKLDNNAANLEWVTPSENSLHAIETGLYAPPSGELSSVSTITNKQADEIRHLILQDVSLKDISCKLKIPKHIVNSVRSGGAWASASPTELVKKCAEYKKPKQLYHSIKHPELLILDIISRLMAGNSVSSVARSTNLSRTYISLINNGKIRPEVIPPCGTTPPYLKNNFVLSARKRPKQPC
ncbi:NUMOD4 motif-containing HNH endonuclease [Acinetobacter towneri]|uniref:NUMOD4 motif-containing HNH endonuclease n=1 Tax=Acinetobacter towneri TaxID=202956 RepID=UPI002934A789|nr:NUMOD4 motif-containing HNH endonuclease [Acinetobacter towneri]WOE29733.1 NUMOD4 motif-containing HNH endonuclease [Acinetobacter towneri]